MLSTELAAEVRQFIEACEDRVIGVGHDQYSEGNTQRFEGMPMDALFEYAEEELRDLAVYATMLHIRLRRVRGLLVGKLGK